MSPALLKRAVDAASDEWKDAARDADLLSLAYGHGMAVRGDLMTAIWRRSRAGARVLRLRAALRLARKKARRA